MFFAVTWDSLLRVKLGVISIFLPNSKIIYLIFDFLLRVETTAFLNLDFPVEENMSPNGFRG
jgi:hypothetical protein